MLKHRKRCWAGIPGALAAVVSVGLLGALEVAPTQAAATLGANLSIAAGTGSYSQITPGPATASPIYYPQTLASDGLGNTFVAFNSGSTDQYAIAKIDSAGTIGYLVNSARTYGAPIPGPALASPFRGGGGIAADAAGNVYVGDFSSRVVAKVDTSGTLSIIAGNGISSSSPLIPGPATSTAIRPNLVAVGPDGSVYIADYNSPQVARVSPAGALTVVAGDGSNGAPVAGPATSSPFTGAFSGLAVDSLGNLFIADQAANCVTMVAASGGALSTVAGLCGSSGPAVPGPAASSQLTSPRQIAIDRHDALYIADQGNKYIERVTNPASGSGTLSILAGDGAPGSMVAGPALSQHVGGVTGLSVDSAMNVFLGVGGGNQLAKISSVASVPDAPTGLTVTAQNASLSLSFSAPLDNGGTAITTYQSSIDAGATWQSLTTTGSGPLTATVSTLTNGTSYTVAVRAVNIVGHSLASTSATATPRAPAPPPAGPTPVALTSTGVGPSAQQATVASTTGDSVSLLDAGGLPVSTVTVPTVGIYSLDPTTGVITFAPAPGFLGTPTGVTFRVTNSAHLAGTAVYTPTVTKPAAPAPTARTSTGPGTQKATISLQVGESLTLLDVAGDSATNVTIDGEGTYVLDTGAITFTPVAGFTGTATGVPFRVSDSYEQHGDSTYRPTVTAATTPTPPLPKIDRSGYLKIPSNPKAVKGKERRTKAFNSSFTGIDAYPIPSLGTHRLAKMQATTLSGDGLFAFDKAKLTRKGRAEVKAVVFNLKNSKTIHCEGYTDYAGERGHEIDLSLSRAKAVCTALKAYGAKVTTMTRGYGPKRPAVVGGSAKSRKENRRVVILVTK